MPAERLLSRLPGRLGVGVRAFLTPEERLAWVAGVYAARPEWTGDFGGEQFSLGRAFYTQFGIDLDELATERRPLCRTCLDWSVRRSHLAGSLGAALLDRMFELNWAKRIKGTRIVAFAPGGEKALKAHFHMAAS